MSMVTSCPECATTFRVTPQQLQTHHGRVRCGRCTSVFDAFKSLATLPDPAPVEPVAGKTDVADQAAPLPNLNFAPVEPELRLDSARASEHSAELPDSPIRPEPTKFSFNAPIDSASPKRRRGAFMLAFLLFILLCAQALYRYRVELATQVPVLRPHLEQMCAALGCALGYPQRPEMLSIEASDLQSTDPALPNRIVLLATLRNRAPVTVAYPAIELTLTNAQDQTIARRVFLPAEYLGVGAIARAGMMPDSESNTKLDLDSGDLKAAGYRLLLFYP